MLSVFNNEHWIFNRYCVKKVKSGSNLVSIGARSILIDAHVHLSDALLRNRAEQISLFLKASRTKVCSVSTDIASSKTVLEQVETFGASSYNFIGIHPSECSKENIQDFLKLFGDNIAKVDGVGEIGLDGSYSNDVKFLKTQEVVFGEMLGLAERHSLPVSAHSRSASLKTIEFLSKYKLEGVLLHWFAGTESELSKANDKGYFVSFGPAIVYSNRMQKLACKASTDLILIETDGPVSYGACFGGKMAEPTFLASVWHSLSYVLGIKPAELEHKLEQNFATYIGKSKG